MFNITQKKSLLKFPLLPTLALILILIHMNSAMTFLDKSQSYAIYDSWNITEAGKLELTFKTQSSYCVILYVDSRKVDSYGIYDKTNNKGSTSSGNVKVDHSFLHVALEQGSVVVTQQIASQKNTRVVRIGYDLNDLEWHHLVITKFVGTLQVELDSLHKIVNYPNNLEEKFRIESRLYVGGLSEKKLEHSSVPDSIKYMTR